MPNKIRNKFTDPLLHEFAPTDLFVNIDDGRLFFRSKNQLFLVNAVISGSQDFLQGITNPNNNSIGVLDTTGGNNTFTSFTNFTFDNTNFLVGNIFAPITTIFTGPTAIVGNITASGNISASGAIIGNGVFEGSITASGDISASGTIFANNFQSTGGDVNGISFTDEVNITGNITASGGITASGDIIIDNDKMFGSKHPTTHAELSIATIDQSTGQTRTIIGNTNIGTTIQSNAGPNPAIDLNAQGGIVTISGSNFLVDTTGHITASGNISASGAGANYFRGAVHIGDAATFPSQLHVSDNINAAEDIIISGSIDIRNNIKGNVALSSDLLNFDQIEANRVKHSENTANTYIDFTVASGIIDDEMTFVCGGTSFLNFKEDSSQDIFNVNPSSQDIDFQVEGSSDGNAIYMQASSDRVGIGTNTPEEKLHVNGNIKATNITASNMSASGIIEASGFSGSFDATGGTITDTNLGNARVIFSDPTVTGQLDSAETFKFVSPLLIVPRISASSVSDSTPGIKCHDFEIDDVIQHAGDTNTRINFGSGFIEFRAETGGGAGARIFQINGNDPSDSLFHVNVANEDVNFRYDGDTNDNVIFADAGTERVGIGTGTPQAKLHIEGDITASGNITGSGLRLGGNAGGTTLGLNSKKAPLGVYHATENVLGIFQSGDSQALIEFRDNDTGGGNFIGCDDEDLIIRTNQGAVKFLLIDTDVQALLVSSSLIAGGASKAARVGVNVNPSLNLPFTSELYVSGSISASNTITCDTLSVTNFNPTSFTTTTINTTNLTVANDATVTGDVSASGDGSFDNLTVAGDLTAIAATVQLTNITASGDISASGDGFFDDLTIKDRVTAPEIVQPDLSNDEVIVSDPSTAGLLNSFNAFKFVSPLLIVPRISASSVSDSTPGIKCHDLEIDSTIQHAGDTDTNMSFGSEFVEFRCANNRMFQINNNSSDSIFHINLANTDINFRVDGDTNDNLFFTDANEEKVGIGTGTPSHKLQVVGNISSSRAFFSSVQSSNDYILDVKNESTVTNTDMVAIRTNVNSPNINQSFIAFMDNGGSDIIDRIRGDGAGGAEFTGEAAGVTSDMRNKQNIVYLKDNYDATNILNKLDVLEYELKSDTNPIKEKHVGFSAQQLLELWPYPVTTFNSDNEKTGAKPGDNNFRYHKVNSGQLTPLIVKTLQEQQKVIEELKLEIDKLKNKCQK